ncbi:hypothetical protein COO60DRAFT_538595 [Scenedesmus sp. NREL 46B-D3]|nr:hypothetical protein COO60DRAFT_538595 [Scenedesmus sp. NREL 46B-D3]
MQASPWAFEPPQDEHIVETPQTQVVTVCLLRRCVSGWLIGPPRVLLQRLGPLACSVSLMVVPMDQAACILLRAALCGVGLRSSAAWPVSAVLLPRVQSPMVGAMKQVGKCFVDSNCSLWATGTGSMPCEAVLLWCGCHWGPRLMRVLHTGFEQMPCLARAAQRRWAPQQGSPVGVRATEPPLLRPLLGAGVCCLGDRWAGACRAGMPCCAWTW